MQEHEEWLKIAQEDFLVAKVLLPQELYSPLVYHCQQAAEKSLKGYLVFKQQFPSKTHDLIRLLEDCLRYDRDFEKLYAAVRLLNPYSSKFRYPTEYDIPDQMDAEIAIQNAKSVVRFVLKKVMAPGTGQTTVFDEI